MKFYFPLSKHGLLAAGTALAGVFLPVASSQAQMLYAYDGFNYTAGSALVGQNGGSGFSAAFTSSAGTGATVTSPGFTYSDGIDALLTEGNKMQLPGGGHSGVYRTLNTTFGTAGTSAYISFLARYDGTATGNGYAALSLYQTPGGAELATFGKNATASLPYWSINPRGGTVSYATADAQVGTMALLVYRIDFTATNALISLAVNPDLNAGEPTVWDAQTTRTSAFPTIGAIRIQGNNVGVFDELRIGQTWSDVTPVPEPSTLGLAILALSGTLLLRRRTKTVLS